MNWSQNIALQPFNTFGIAVTARQMLRLSSEEEVIQHFLNDDFKAQKQLILGGGSNLLFQQDYFDGIILKNEIKGKTVESETEEEVIVRAGAGENWHEFVLWTLAQGYFGLENLSLIPGTVGASPVQNIGAYGVELQDVFASAIAIHKQTGQKHVFKSTDCEFGYRNSVFKTKYKDQFCITSVSFRLSKKPIINDSYGAIKNTLEAMHLTVITPKAVSDAVIQIRSSKLPNPAVIGNAGSFFKNPEISNTQLTRLQTHYPAIIHYPLANEMEKIPAGWLIEQCGWKGKKVGNTGTYQHQALVLVNHGNATGAEIVALAERIEASVFKKFGIQLSREVNIVE